MVGLKTPLAGRAPAMPKKLELAISPLEVVSLGVGKHADGGGLYLVVTPRADSSPTKPTFNRTWQFTYRSKLTGRTREMGLGPAPLKPSELRDDNKRERLTLASARERARELRAVVRGGGDPLAERAAALATKLAAAQSEVIASKAFRDVATAYTDGHGPGWRNAKHRAQWTSTLATYVHPVFGDIAVKDVTTAHVMQVLEPIWSAKTETATRVRGRIEMILDYAKAREWRTGENPARWRGHIANMLPAPRKVTPVEHHAALSWSKIGDFMVALRGRHATSARALEFAILTAGRTGEVLGARWSEIDPKTGLWTVPASRMKAGREHRVPLPAAAVSILNDIAKLRPDSDSAGTAFIFPGEKSGRPMSDMAFLMLLRRMDQDDLTAHGFRSTFRDWCSEMTSYPHEMAEMALAHTVGDKVEAAYRRGDMLEKRRRMMDDWATFCARPMEPAGNVTPIRPVQTVAS